MTEHAPYDIPVLVMGAGITALGVTRILGRQRIPMFHADTSDQVLRSSRWFRPAPWLGPKEKGLSLCELLGRCNESKMVLMPCNDTGVDAVAQLEAGLRMRFPSFVPAWNIVEILTEKGRFAKALQCAGTSHPRTILLDDAKGLEAIRQFPDSQYFLKPRSSVNFFSRYGVKAFLVSSYEEAVARYQQVQEAGLSVMLQEYVPGSSADHYFIDGYRTRDGVIATRLARRRLRMNPPDFGNSSFMRTVPISEVASAVKDLEDFLAHIGYTGIYSGEFKRDARDGVFRLLEINARPWWYVEYAAACGADVCTPAYLDALNLPVPVQGNYKVGVEGVYPYYDYGACKRLRERGELALREWLVSWLRGWKPIFTKDDPLPFLRWFLNSASGWFGRRLWWRA